MIVIKNEPPGCTRRIEHLLDRAFGPDRKQKTAQRLRDGRRPAPGLAFVAFEDDVLIGTLTFWNVCIGGEVEALLLGPIAVETRLRGLGIASQLIRHGLRTARSLKHRAVILVGDEPYYQRFGFSHNLTWRMSLPGPVDRKRFLGLELIEGGLTTARGLVQPTGVLADSRFLNAG